MNEIIATRTVEKILFYLLFYLFFSIFAIDNWNIYFPPMPKQAETLCSERTLYDAWNVVKEKGSAGGIDGVTIQIFDKEKRKEIPKLAEELKAGTWKP